MLKFTRIFFFFSCTRLKSRNWVNVEQALKNIKLEYYKIYNISTNKVMSSSIFKNANKLISNGSTLLVNLDIKSIDMNLPLITKLFVVHQLLTFLSIKINNKTYSSVQIEKVNFSNYDKNLSIFCCTIKRNLKKQFVVLNF